MIADQKKIKNRKGKQNQKQSHSKCNKAKFWLLPLISRTNSAQFCNIMYTTNGNN